MMLFDASGAIKRYESPEAIIEEFYGLRLSYYEKRRASQIRVRGGALGCTVLLSFYVIPAVLLLPAVDVWHLSCCARLVH